MRRHETEKNNSFNRSQRDSGRNESQRFDSNRYDSSRYDMNNRDQSSFGLSDQEDRYMGGNYASNGDYSVDGVRFGRDRDEDRSRFSEGSDWNRSRFADSAMSNRNSWGSHPDSRYSNSRSSSMSGYGTQSGSDSQFGSGYGSQYGGGNKFGSMDNYSTSSNDFSRREGLHSGKGPKGYKRSDDRIREEVCEALSRSAEVDASDIDVTVKEGMVTLSGTVESRMAKREAEMCVEHLSGIEDVHNEIRVKKNEGLLSGMTGSKKESSSSFRNEKLA